MRRVLASALFVLLAGCNSSEERSAMDMVRAGATDPDAVRFEMVHTGPTGTVCGRANMPNATGGYSGFQVFTFSESDSLQIAPPFARISELLGRPVEDRQAHNEAMALLDEFNRFAERFDGQCDFPENQE